MRAATVVQVLHCLFYVLLQLLVVDAIILSFMFYRKFYCKFYCCCDPCISNRRRSGLMDQEKVVAASRLSGIISLA